MRYWGIVPAAGQSQRAGEGGASSQSPDARIPKQYRQVAGATILEHSIRPLLKCGSISAIVVALQCDDCYWQDNPLSREPLLRTTVGGETRAQSVARALDSLSANDNARDDANDDAKDDDWVLVHDGSRPCLSVADVKLLISSVADDPVGGLLVAPINDSIKLRDDTHVKASVRRKEMVRALTPQMFRYRLLKDAMEMCLKENRHPADCAEAIESAGHKARLVHGAATNIKVTYPEDFAFVEAYLSRGNN